MEVAIKNQGRNDMTMGPIKVRTSSRKQAEHFRSKKYPFDAALLNVTEDSEQLRRNVSRLIEQGEEIANETIFQTLLSDANRELASLLQDVRKVEEDPLLDDGQVGRMKKLVMRAVHCAAKQYMLQAELGNLALTDELTGLCNRRGFMAIAERQLKIGHRTGRGIVLFFMDIDGMKQINDSFGHGEGDRALKRMAKALKMTFRDSDVIARLGGDEFKLVSTQPGNHVRISKSHFQGLGHTLQRTVAFAMPKRIVNLFHAVNVHEEQNNSTPRTVADLQLALRNGHESAAVAQAREFIG